MHDSSMNPESRIFEAALRKLQLYSSARMENPAEVAGGRCFTPCSEEETIIVIAEKNSDELIELIGTKSKFLN